MNLKPTALLAPLLMKLSPRQRIALAGALWFPFVACIGFTLLMMLLMMMFFNGRGSNNPLEIFMYTGGGLYMFGLPAAVVGSALANSIANTTQGIRVFMLGVLLVLLTNILAAAWGEILAHGFVNTRLFLGGVRKLAAIYLIFDIFPFMGAPFLLGGFAAMVFRDRIEYGKWFRNKPLPLPSELDGQS